MCGIIGIVRFAGLQDQDSTNLARGMDLMQHRGPDAKGIWQSHCNKVLLGHRRLSIVDLSEHGSQPMKNDRYTIVFNGEVYNHQELRHELEMQGYLFRGHSDTEVLLTAYAHWGERCINKINGVFAFAIFDSTQQEIAIFRDRIGEKPLFFSNTNEYCIFSSELTSLLALRNTTNTLNIQSTVSYFTNGYMVNDATPIEGVNALLPGTFCKVKLEGAITHSRYWKLPRGEDETHNRQYLMDKLNALLKDSIDMQLQCDVPACILLSGGVDSSLLTAYASEVSSQVKTFTVSFKGFSEFDESSSAKLVARHFGTDHTEVEGVNIDPELFIDISQSIDIPFNDSSIIPTYTVYNAVSQHCKVALGGDGGDELFGGYKHYNRMQRLQQIIGHFYPLYKIGRLSAIKNFLPESRRYRNWFECLEHDLRYSIPNIRSIFGFKDIEKLLPSVVTAEHLNNFEWEKNSKGYGSVLKNTTGSDFNTYLRDSILVKSDRCSMCNSVEARAPFLDFRIMEFAFSEVPDRLKVNGSYRKLLLKELAKRVLPVQFDFERKLGFNLPLEAFIRKGKWKEAFGDLMHTKNSIIDLEYRTSLFHRHLHGENLTDQIFGICLFLQWCRRVNIG